MRIFYLFSFILVVAFLFFFQTSNLVFSITPTKISLDDKAIDLTGFVTFSHENTKHFQISTAPSQEGIVRRIEVTANQENPRGWAVFALSNTTDQQIDRLIVAPHSRLINSGIFWPDLGEIRIAAITPSEGFALDRQNEHDADVFHLTLNPGSVITFVAELSSSHVPKIYLWSPDAYKDAVNAYSLFRGIVIGIAGLLALFLTILFLVRGTSIFPAAAAFSWSVLAYICIDFGFLSEIIYISKGNEQLWRASTEIALAATLIIFLFTYLNLNRWHDHFNYAAAAWLAGLILIAALALYHPPFSAGIARISFATTVFIGAGLIIVLSARGYDRAIMLIPGWLMVLLWTGTYAVTIFGILDNDVVQPALAGGLTLVILLIGFTIIQHTFTGGLLQQGLLSDMERSALALSGSGNILWDWDVIRDRVITEPDISVFLRLAPKSLTGAIRNWLPALHAEDRDAFRSLLDAILEHRRGRISEDFRLRSADGYYHWFSLHARPVVGANGEVFRCVGTLVDVTYQKKSEARLMHDALHDNLTGLPNRQVFMKNLETTITLARLYKNIYPTLFIIDIDNFKNINASLGISAGDTILLTLARRFNRLLKPNDSLCRFSGNRFALLLFSEKNSSSISDFAHKISQIFHDPINFSRQEISFTVSIGFINWSPQYEHGNDLFKDAELALYQAKHLGGNRIEAFHPTFRLIGTDVLQLEADFENALVQKDFTLSFQPIVNLESKNILGVHVFLEWEHPDKGKILPSEFITIAESHDLIHQLWLLALQNATEEFGKWNVHFPNSNIFMELDLPSSQLIRSELITDIRSFLMRSNIKPSSFCIGFSESQIMENPEKSLRVIPKLKKLGVRLCLDRFGSGPSSLYYLANFPFDTLKVEKDLPYNQLPISDKNAFLKSVTTIGSGFGMSVIVKDELNLHDIEQLKIIGCKYVQSDFFSPPLKANAMLSLLSQNKNDTLPTSDFFLRSKPPARTKKSLLFPS